MPTEESVSLSWFLTVPSDVISNTPDVDPRIPPTQPVQVPVIVISETVVAPVIELVPVTVRFPVTVVLSLMFVSPVAESRVRSDVCVVTVEPSKRRSESTLSCPVFMISGFNV